MVKIEISKGIYEDIERRLGETTDFKSVEEYVAFVLEEVFKEEDEDSEEHVFSEEDEEKVKERLRGLGYL